jgi:hypothetical protein
LLLCVSEEMELQVKTQVVILVRWLVPSHASWVVTGESLELPSKRDTIVLELALLNPPPPQIEHWENESVITWAVVMLSPSYIYSYKNKWSYWAEKAVVLGFFLLWIQLMFKLYWLRNSQNSVLMKM